MVIVPIAIDFAVSGDGGFRAIVFDHSITIGKNFAGAEVANGDLDFFDAHDQFCAFNACTFGQIIHFVPCI